MAESSLRLALLKQVAAIEENYPLGALNPLGLGGNADYFVIVKDTIELASAVKAAIDLTLPYVVIGEGRSVLFPDTGFPGLVIQNQAAAHAFALDKSQVVVDSGMPLNRFITLAASYGLGGLTEFYGEAGTVGGALYAGLRAGEQPLLSSVRYVTMIMPPARLDKEATINRYKREWLEREPGETRLQHIRKTHALTDPTPVILTVLFQLTSLREDEVRTRLQTRSVFFRRKQPKGTLLGPMFHLEGKVPVEDVLHQAKVSSLRVGDIVPDRSFPNYFRIKGRSPKSQDVKALVELIQEKLAERYSVQLVCQWEFPGVW